MAANQQAFQESPKPFVTLEDYTAVFKVLPLPDIAKTFQSDATFAKQRLSGPNPMELTNVLALNYNLQEKLGITDEIFQTVLKSQRGKGLLKARSTLPSTVSRSGSTTSATLLSRTIY